MGYQITAPELISRIRNRVADRDGEVWSDDEILARVDQVLEQIWTIVRLAGRDHTLDSVELTPASFTSLGNQAWSYEPPSNIAHIRSIEGMVSANSISQPFYQSELHSKDWTRYSAGGYVTWHRGPQGTIRLVGNIGRYSTIVLYYLRRWPPIHYGTAAGNGTTTTLKLDTSPVGRVVKRTGVYEGHLIQFTSGANVDLVVRVTAYDRTSHTVTFTPAVTATANNDAYSLLIPVDAEHSDMVAIDATMSLLASGGNDDYLASLAPLQQEARERFRSALSARDQDSPRTVWSNDR